MPQAGKRGIAIQLDAQRRHVRRRRPQEDPPGRVEPAVERGEVHARSRPRRRRRCGAGRCAARDRQRRARSSSSVSDSGIGISRDQVAKIFEPFFQVDSSSTRAFGGTRPRPHAREGVRRSARRPDLGRHDAGAGLDVHRDVPDAARGAAELESGSRRRDSARDRVRRGVGVLLGRPRSRCSRSAESIASSSARSERGVDAIGSPRARQPRRLIATVLIGNEARQRRIRGCRASPRRARCGRARRRGRSPGSCSLVTLRSDRARRRGDDEAARREGSARLGAGVRVSARRVRIWSRRCAS